MPKPQHLDDKLYVNMVLLLLVFDFSCLFGFFFRWLLSNMVFVLLLFGLHVHLKIHHFYL